MSVTAVKVGRNLHLTFDGIDEPFVISPLPARAGIQVTDTYLKIHGGADRAQELTDALQMAADGAVKDDTGRWVPLPEDQQINFNRIGEELSQAEAEQIIMPALFWQTVLGMDGVTAYLEEGGGLPGTLKAAGALSHRLGPMVIRALDDGAAA